MLEIKEITFGYDKLLLDRINLELENEIAALIGPSGCGKSTLLQIIAGLLKPHSGSITLNNTSLSSLSCEKRNIGLVFQDYALFPHLTVEKNILFGIKDKAKLDEFLTLMEITHLRKKYPHQLSGGEAQRVAIARSLAAEPSALLLDEPFSNLDLDLKLRLQEHLKQIQKQYQLPILFVSHDKADIENFAQKIYELRNQQLHKIQ